MSGYGFIFSRKPDSHGLDSSIPDLSIMFSFKTVPGTYKVVFVRSERFSYTAQLLEIDHCVPKVKREQELNEKLTKRLAEDGNGSIVSQVTVGTSSR